MSMEKLLLIILFIAVSYYPLCGIIGLIRYIRGEELSEELRGKKMTRFEEASLNSMNMSIMVAFCIARYLEQSGIMSFTDGELKEFMSEISTDIEEWLRGEENDN